MERCGDGAGLTDALDGAEDEEHGPVDGEAVDDGEDADDGEAGDEQRLRAVYGAKPAALQRVDINLSRPEGSSRGGSVLTVRRKAPKVRE